ncbi:hypothetical protein EYC80_005915 [Monilinia laxa]|uniref:Uncharacterized protein n=1 Tax=Monilinia laxa TaxID=61186 RepID=A0A5N6KFJ1_MONLA|nr:hypothetical protein EYC80_005915 [Monilinia laxa]
MSPSHGTLKHLPTHPHAISTHAILQDTIPQNTTLTRTSSLEQHLALNKILTLRIKINQRGSLLSYHNHSNSTPGIFHTYTHNTYFANTELDFSSTWVQSLLANKIIHSPYDQSTVTRAFVAHTNMTSS